ncbi:FmdB family zinc ribbon protein [Syntrophus buswellii]|uniref:FmdB family zinc ribbon protein n=1 Tax=Syntrophus buswellii TaxID=43774 RepID=UPI0038D484B8
MPTYEYECELCGLKFERQQAISEGPLSECPECRGAVRRLISGGTGFLFKVSGRGREGCSLERTGRTCCGREERCGNASCGENS